MLDLSYIPNNQENIKIFYSTGIANAWQTWQKPRKCQYVWIMSIGGAGGGAGGISSGNGPYSTGGGSGAVTRALFNASHLPDTLYIQVGIGGAGGAAVTAGSAGSSTRVSLLPNITATNVVVGSAATVAAGGTLASGLNAAGETASTTATMVFGTLANFISTAGVTAVGAGLIQAPDLVPLTSQIVTAGGGGSSWDVTPQLGFAGASILSSSVSPLIQGGVGTNTLGTSGGNGSNGFTSWKPFFSTGGAGGGSAISGSGGNGGNGGIGSGGGAGGCGNSTLGYIGGTGGKGGDGLVVIVSF